MEFDSSDEHIPFHIDDDYLDEVHPQMSDDDLEEIEGYESDYLSEVVPDPDDAFTELDTWSDVREDD